MTHEQLVIEVERIYTGLREIETKCIDINEQKSAARQKKDSKPQWDIDMWRSLMALHKQLLHENQDFLFASQHPSANESLQNLARVRDIPKRMWRYGILAFLDNLYPSLPDSMEHMVAFIHIAYPMVASCLDVVPMFKDTWTECLGKLSNVSCDQSDLLIEFVQEILLVTE